MKILLVEDEVAAADAFREELDLSGLTLSLDIARSRTSALEALDGGFDVVVCDLRIPISDGGLDINEEHGVYVVREATQRHANTPVVILTGFGSLENIGALINQPIRDVFGSGTPIPLVRWVSKKKYSELIAILAGIQADLDALEAVAVNIAGLSEDDSRALRVFARLKHASVIEGDRAAAGLSSATPFRVRLSSDRGRVVGAAFIKVADDAAIQAEAHRVREYVDGVLPAGTYPPVTMVLGGTGARSALCQAIVGDAEDLYSVLEADEDRAIELVSLLERVQDQYWVQGAQLRQLTIADLRRARGVSDALVARVTDLGAESLEAETLEVVEAVQHGDFHGANILTDGQGATMMVDFALTGPAAVSLDPVVLELSFLFHPDARKVAGPWADTAPLDTWFDGNEFFRDAPYPRFLRAVREWAMRSGPRSVLANCYCHAVRQLAYPNVDEERARRLIATVVRQWASTIR